MVYKRIKDLFLRNLGPNLLQNPRVFPAAIALMRGMRGSYSLQASYEMSLFALQQTQKAFNQGFHIWSNIFAPNELIYAMGFVPFSPEVGAAVLASVGLAERGLQVSEERWYSRDLCSFHRCALGYWNLGLIPGPHFSVYTSHLCDGNLHTFSQVVPDDRVALVDIPFFPSDTAVDYVAAQLEALVKRLENLLGNPLGNTSLKEAFTRSNEAREYKICINAIRRERPGLLKATQSLGFLYLDFTSMGSEGAVSVYRTLYRELKHMPKPATNGPRILWLHLAPFHSPLIDLLEKEFHMVVVMEEMTHVYWPPLDPSQPWESLARKLLSNPGIGPLTRRVETVSNLCREYRADGVIHFQHWGCRQSAGGIGLLKKELNEQGIPFLNLEGDCIDPRGFTLEQIRTRVGAFLEALQRNG